MSNSKDCIIYDFETLGQKPTSAVLCLAALRFNEDRYLSDEPYTYKGLLDSARFIKFSVREQVEMYGRRIDKSTIDWWKTQSQDAQELIKESEADQPLAEIVPFFRDLIVDPSQISKVYTRGNTFDPIFLDSILENVKSPEVYNWWTIRDTRSMIDGLSFGSGLKNMFMVPGLEESFIRHDPIHDIAMDVMRMQYLVRETMIDDE
mgnify:FL=1